MTYCENCEIVFEGVRCPVCGGKKAREPAPNDPCFLCTLGAVESEMLCEALKDSGVPVVKKGRFGAGMALKVGLMAERSRIYVPYCRLADSKRIYGELFPAEDAEDGERR